jgi:hypothetical protein
VNAIAVLVSTVGRVHDLLSDTGRLAHLDAYLLEQGGAEGVDSGRKFAEGKRADLAVGLESLVALEPAHGVIHFLIEDRAERCAAR